MQILPERLPIGQPGTVLVKNSLTFKLEKMKNLITYISLITVFVCFGLNAQENNPMEKAIEKGKSDLLEILSKTEINFNFAVNPEQLRNARGATEVPFKQMDFQQLLTYNEEALERLLSPTEKFIIPMVTGNQVVTTLTIGEKQGRYEVTELINQQYTSEMNMLPTETLQNNFRDVTIIHVPNLRATIYKVKESVYTAYKGRSLREAQDVTVLMQELKRDAIEFQVKYGDLLKKGRLVD